ncbi:MAG: hypothetical protein DDT34_01802 [Firmicutes bacterium]|nr:hypothetical protein [Bacillota bacterium]
MVRRLYVLVLVLVVLASSSILWERYLVERQNRQVALLMDGTDLYYRARQESLDLPLYLRRLKEAGLYGIASHVMPLRDMAILGDVVIRGAGADAREYAAGLGLRSPLPTQSLLHIKDEQLQGPIIKLIEELSLGQEVTVFGSVVYTEMPVERLRRASLGFPPTLIAAIDEVGLAFLPVFSPYTGSSVRAMAEFLTTRDFAGVMFTGNRLADDLSGVEELKRVITERNLRIYWLQRHDTLRGYVPLVGVEGILTDESRIIRGFRPSRLETNNPLVTPYSMTDRWLGSVKEYNVRAIYMRPFYRAPDIEYNEEYVRLLAASVRKAGFTLGSAESFRRFYPRPWQFFFVAAGIALLGLAVVRKFKLPPLLGYLGVGAVVFSQIFLLTPWSVYLRLSVALGGAIIASMAALALWKDEKNPWRGFFLINVTTLGLALLVASYLSDYYFIAEFEYFRGVKLQYTAPLVILAGLLFVPRFKKLFGEIREEVRRIGVLGAALLVLLFASAVVIYVWRAGHVHSISQFELNLRFWMEEVLIARPRFKEILIHPVLLVIMYFRRNLSRLMFEGGLVVVAIAQVSIVNTFMHLRTPLAHSLLRTFHGLWIGAILGLAAIVVLRQMIALYVGMTGRTHDR